MGLIALRPLLSYLLERAGNGELLPMFGLFAAVVVGATSFSAAGLKPDLGALVLGMMMANHRRAGDVADALFTLKEVMLVGFFLNIGHDRGRDAFASRPDRARIGAAGSDKVGAVLPDPARASGCARDRRFLAAASLSSYSEFGLIVGAVAYREWLAGRPMRSS